VDHASFKISIFDECLKFLLLEDILMKC
jgi:hypothetical protein